MKFAAFDLIVYLALPCCDVLAEGSVGCCCVMGCSRCDKRNIETTWKLLGVCEPSHCCMSLAKPSHPLLTYPTDPIRRIGHPLPREMFSPLCFNSFPSRSSCRTFLVHTASLSDRHQPLGPSRRKQTRSQSP